MISSEDWELLERRICALEAACFGAEAVTLEEAYQFPFRLTALEEKLKTIDGKIPELQPCIDMLQQSFPSLTQKRSSLKQAIEKAEELVAQKQALLDVCRTLQSTKELEKHIDAVELLELAELREKVVELESQLAGVQDGIQKQTAKLDELVGIYEQSVMYVNKVCATWEWSLENKSASVK